MVSASGDFDAAKVLLRSFEPDLVIMDTQRDPDGAVRVVREQSDCLLVVMQSTQHPSERISLLRAGVDDVVSATIDHDELNARCEAMLRRHEANGNGDDTPDVLEVGPLAVDRLRHEIRLDDNVVAATRIEFSLLEQLAARAEHVVSREDLLRGVWGPHWVGDPHVVDVHLSNLRRKLDAAMPGVQVIQTVRGIGFRLSDDLLSMASA